MSESSSDPVVFFASKKPFSCFEKFTCGQLAGQYSCNTSIEYGVVVTCDSDPSGNTSCTDTTIAGREFYCHANSLDSYLRNCVEISGADRFVFTGCTEFPSDGSSAATICQQNSGTITVQCYMDMSNSLYGCVRPVSVMCDSNPSSLLSCPSGTTNKYICYNTPSDLTYRDCVEVSSSTIVYSCSGFPTDGLTSSQAGCGQVSQWAALASLYKCSIDLDSKLRKCESCSSLQLADLASNAAVTVKNCVLLGGGAGYACSDWDGTTGLIPKDKYTCYGSRTDCGTYTTCNRDCTVTQLVSGNRVKFDCTQAAGLVTGVYNCAGANSATYASTIHYCDYSYSACSGTSSAYSSTFSSCETQNPWRTQFLCSTSPNGLTDSTIPNCVSETNANSHPAEFTQYHCKNSPQYDQTLRCIQVAGVAKKCRYGPPIDLAQCFTPTVSEFHYYYCYGKQSDGKYYYCADLESDTKTSFTCGATAPQDGSLDTDYCVSGSTSYNCYSLTLSGGSKRLYGCTPTSP